MLSRREARRFYDRFGAKQDSQAFYEDAALDVLVAHGRFDEAEAVVELGSGTGRFAQRLLQDHLPHSASYHGYDQSSTMVELAHERLKPFGDRAEVELTDGAMRLPLEDQSCDRFVSTYVLDLLSPEDIEVLVADAHRLLVPGGLLCLSGLTRGTTLLSKTTASIFSAVHRLRPALVGGCRPVELLGFVGFPDWETHHHATVVSWTVPSEALVAAARAPGQ